MIASLRRARNLFHYKIYVPVVLFILAVISYGLLIPSLGYYGDDWSMSWLAYQSHHVAFLQLTIFLGSLLATVYSLRRPHQALKLNPELFQVFCYLKQRLPVDSQPSKDQQKFLDALQCKDVIH